MLDLRKKLGELTGAVKGSVAEGLNNLRAGIQDTATSVVDTVGNAMIDNVFNPILDAKEAHDKKKRQDEVLARPSTITPGNKTITRNAEGLPPVVTPLDSNTPPPVVTPLDSNTPPSVDQSASVVNAVKPKQDKSKDVLSSVPNEYKQGLTTALSHLNRFSTGGQTEPSGRQYDEVKIENLLAKISGEGGWNPTAGNKAVDYGITQLNIKKRKDLKDPKTISGKSWKDNFEKEYGKFDENNPTHQIIGGSIVLAGVRQELTDAFESGIIKRKPTQADIFAAYNMDYGQVIDAINGKDYQIQITSNDSKKKGKTLQQQYNDYLDYLKSKGFAE